MSSSKADQPSKEDTRTRILQATRRLMELNNGQGVKMSDIAKDAGISRQALYLHFASRTDLMIATNRYVDEVNGLEDRLDKLKAASSALELLENSVELWAEYIPEIYGLVKALENSRHRDEASAAAWKDSMECLRRLCSHIISSLAAQDQLDTSWKKDEAVDALWTMLSISNWELLTQECGWTIPQYIEGMKIMVKQSFVTICE